jgi:hypothetical protein
VPDDAQREIYITAIGSRLKVGADNGARRSNVATRPRETGVGN